MALFRRKGPVDPEARFLAEASRILEAQAHVVRVEQPAPFELVAHRTGGREPFLANLRNLWVSVQEKTSDEQDELLHRLLAVDARPAQPASWAELAPLLRPVVRSVGWTSGAPGLVRRRLAPFLVEAVAVDQVDAMSFLTQDQVAGLQVDEDEALDRARANLAAIGCSPLPADGELAGGVFLTAPDAYESSWLVLPGALADLAGLVGGHPLVLAPSRSSALVVAEEDERLVVAALAWAKAAYEAEPRPISTAAYRPDETGLVPWEAPPGHAAWAPSQLGTRFLALVEYDDQTAQVLDLMTKAGEDVFVASLKVLRREDDSVHSSVVWPRAVTDGLLPAADEVVLFDEEDRFAVPFEDVVRVAGEWFVAEDWDPPRWRIRGWPPADVVAELRSLAVDA